MAEDVPYFIEMRGCVKCGASKNHKQKHGQEYGFDHETIIPCIVEGCIGYDGICLIKPFVDPQDVVDFAKKHPTHENLEGARRYCDNVEKKWGNFYREMCVSILEMKNKLDEF